MRFLRIITFSLAGFVASICTARASLDQPGWTWFAYPWAYSSVNQTWTYLVPTDSGLWLNDTVSGEWRFQGEEGVWSTGDPRPTLAWLVDRVIFIEDTWAGQSFTLKQTGTDYAVLWRVFGSGVPVVHEQLLPAIAPSLYQVQFSIGEKEAYRIAIPEAGRIKAYLNGKRIHARLLPGISEN